LPKDLTDRETKIRKKCNEKTAHTIRDISSGMKEFPIVKWAVNTAIVVGGLYAAGKLFRATASCVRDLNDLRSSINGK
jgi:hypothetical protein